MLPYDRSKLTHTNQLQPIYYERIINSKTLAKFKFETVDKPETIFSRLKCYLKWARRGIFVQKAFLVGLFYAEEISRFDTAVHARTLDSAPIRPTPQIGPDFRAAFCLCLKTSTVVLVRFAHERTC